MSMKFERDAMTQVANQCQTLTGVNKNSITVYDELVREVFKPGNIQISNLMGAAIKKFEENTEMRQALARKINEDVREALAILKGTCSDMEIEFTMPVIED